MTNEHFAHARVYEKDPPPPPPRQLFICTGTTALLFLGVNMILMLSGVHGVRNGVSIISDKLNCNKYSGVLNTCTLPLTFSAVLFALLGKKSACMAVAAILAASMILLVTGGTRGNPSIVHFWRPALSCTVASPFGCECLSSQTVCGGWLQQLLHGKKRLDCSRGGLVESMTCDALFFLRFFLRSRVWLRGLRFTVRHVLLAWCLLAC